MRHAVECVCQVLDRCLYLLLGDPLGQKIDRHLNVWKMHDLHDSAHDPSSERLPPAQLMAHLYRGALATRNESIGERIGGHDHGVVERQTHGTANLMKVLRLHTTLCSRVHLGSHRAIGSGACNLDLILDEEAIVRDCHRIPIVRSRRPRRIAIYLGVERRRGRHVELRMQIGTHTGAVLVTVTPRGNTIVPRIVRCLEHELDRVKSRDTWVIGQDGARWWVAHHGHAHIDGKAAPHKDRLREGELTQDGLVELLIRIQLCLTLLGRWKSKSSDDFLEGDTLGKRGGRTPTR